MNNINNIFNKNEIENKLKDFQEGQDYSVSPTDEPNIKTYNFHNDRLRSVFRNDRVPVRITQEAYDGKDYTYRGHFEEGKDYRYIRQDWQFGENYQGNRGTDVFGEGDFKNFMDGIKWDEHYRENSPGKWEVGWTYRGKGKNIGRGKGNLNGNPEPRKIESNQHNELELKRKHEELINKLNSYQNEPQSKERDWKIEMVKKDIAKLESEIEKYSPINLAGSNTTADLQEENQELRQELSEVKKQLAQVLAELKKLKNNSVGQNNKELDQQIVQNEQLIKEGEKVSELELRKQVQKSEALLKNQLLNTTSPVNDNKKGNGSLPYLIAGSAFVLVGIIGYYLVKKNRGKKVA